MELKKIVLRLPAVLSYSYEANIKPKLAYLQKELRLSEEALRETVLMKPALLSYSLEKRFKPRVKLCREVGASVLLVVSYDTLTDEKFKKLLSRRRGDDATQRRRGSPLSRTRKK